MTTIEPGTAMQPTQWRAGVAYAGLAAASAGILLFLPILLLGITVALVTSAMLGEVVGWRGSADLTYVFIGIPALLSLVLLIVPKALFRAADSRIGARQAIRWSGGLLAAWNAALALIWLGEAASGFAPVLERDELWYATAFGIAAVVTLLATVFADMRARRAALALFGVLGFALVGLVVVLVLLWGSPPIIPAGAQTVHITVTGSEVRLDPASVRAGTIYFVVDGPDDPAGHAGFTFVSAGYGSQCCEAPLPLDDDAVNRLARGDYERTGIEGGWGRYARFTLLEGEYAFLSGGDEPGVPPESVVTLEVRP